jgi:hypothetical protein
MTKSTKANPPAETPAFPNAAIDFNQVHANVASGATGDDVFKDALSVAANVSEQTPASPEPEQPADADAGGAA